MGYTFRKENVMVVKANRYTHAKEGYLVFWGDYPYGGSKYFKSKSAAIKFAKKKVKKRR